jgi:hypothetical protein
MWSAWMTIGSASAAPGTTAEARGTTCTISYCCNFIKKITKGHTMIEWPNTVGVLYSLIRKLSHKVSANRPVLAKLLLEPFRVSLQSASSADRRRPRTLTPHSPAAFPSCTPLPPWWGVPMKTMPYVEVLIERCSSSAPFRAASEWMRA